MQRALPERPSFRLRPATVGAQTGANSSVLRVARNAAVARAALLLQRSRNSRQLAFDFIRGGR